MKLSIRIFIWGKSQIYFIIFIDVCLLRNLIMYPLYEIS
jgi:hypothetical protein